MEVFLNDAHEYVIHHIRQYSIDLMYRGRHGSERRRMHESRERRRQQVLSRTCPLFWDRKIIRCSGNVCISAYEAMQRAAGIP